MVKHIKRNKMKNLLTKNFSKNFMSGMGDRHSINYSFDKNSKLGNIQLLNRQRNRKKIINDYFSTLKNVTSSEPVFMIRIDKVIINLSYYRNDVNPETKNLLALNSNTINNLGHVLSKVFGRPVELRIISLKYPLMDRSVFAKYLGQNQSNITFHRFNKIRLGNRPVYREKDFKNIELDTFPQDSHILGIKIRLSGRLESEPVRPKQRPVTKLLGCFKGNKDTLVDFGSYTGYNSLGAFTIKVWINHKVNTKEIKKSPMY